MIAVGVASARTSQALMFFVVINLVPFPLCRAFSAWFLPYAGRISFCFYYLHRVDTVDCRAPLYSCDGLGRGQRLVTW